MKQLINKIINIFKKPRPNLWITVKVFRANSGKDPADPQNWEDLGRVSEGYFDIKSSVK